MSAGRSKHASPVSNAPENAARLGLLHRSRVLFKVDEMGQLSCHREISCGGDKLMLAALLENEALRLKAEGLIECGHAVFSSAA